MISNCTENNLNKRIEAITKTLVEHYERVYRVNIKESNSKSEKGQLYYQKVIKATFKFIEEAYGPAYESDTLEVNFSKIYFIGISGSIYYVNTFINKEAKAQNIIRFKKHKTKQIKCYGQYCEFIKQEDNEELKEIDEVSESNKNMFKNEFYEVFGTLISKSFNNAELVDKILTQHKIFHKNRNSEK